jgi:SAM-dependent methyltransferase
MTGIAPTFSSVARRLVKRSYWATCAGLLVRNCLDARRFAAGNIETSSGTLHSGWSPIEGVTYIEEVVRDYAAYAGVDAFRGRVAEVGPGDNCGVALLLLANGCDHVDLADRYYSKRNPAQQAAIYRALAERHPRVREMLADADLTNEETFPRLSRYYGKRAAAEEFFSTHGEYDLIISRAVGEHLYDPCRAVRAMAKALRPGGTLLHKIDLRDHEMFSLFHGELKWLEVPESLYRLMTSASGRPNRVLAHEYRNALVEAGLNASLLVTRLAGVGDITPHKEYDAIESDVRRRAEQFVNARRRHFARKFQPVAAKDLATAGIFLVATKPK